MQHENFDSGVKSIMNASTITLIFLKTNQVNLCLTFILCTQAYTLKSTIFALQSQGLEEFRLEKYVDSRANMTVLRLMMDYDSRGCSLSPDQINLQYAIFHDAVTVYDTYVAERANMTHFSMRQANRQVLGIT